MVFFCHEFHELARIEFVEISVIRGNLTFNNHSDLLICGKKITQIYNPDTEKLVGFFI
jgi:hypothetical protein